MSFLRIPALTKTNSPTPNRKPAGIVRAVGRKPFRVSDKSGWASYSFQKNAWIAAHPDATHEDIDKAAQSIARRMGL